MNKQELNRFIDKISPTGPGGVEKIKRVLKEVLDKGEEGITEEELLEALTTKQDTLVSGTNIKTVNNTSLLGSGNIAIPKGDKGDKGDTGPQGPQGPQGLKGDTGVSADYPITIYNGLDSDATDQALSAAQGNVLDGKIGQLGQEVNRKIGFFENTVNVVSGTPYDNRIYGDFKTGDVVVCELIGDITQITDSLVITDDSGNLVDSTRVGLTNVLTLQRNTTYLRVLKSSPTTSGAVTFRIHFGDLQDFIKEEIGNESKKYESVLSLWEEIGHTSVGDKIIGTNGTPVNATRFSYNIFLISDTTKRYYFKTRLTSSRTVVVHYYGNGVHLGGAVLSETSINQYNGFLDVPSNTDEIRINRNSADGAFLYATTLYDGSIPDAIKDISEYSEILSGKTNISKTSSITGKFLKNDGTLGNASGFAVDYYDITDTNKEYHFTTKNGGAGINAVHYFNGETHLGYQYPITSGTTDYSGPLSIPTGTTIIAINRNSGDTSSLYYKELYNGSLVEKVLDNSDRITAIEGGTYNIVLIGDSITWLSGVNCTDDRGWGKWFKDKFNPQTIKNYAWSGATWSNTENTVATDTEISSLDDNNTIWQQIRRLIADVNSDLQVTPDVVIIAAGVNDVIGNEAGVRPNVFSKTAEQAFSNRNSYITEASVQTITTLADSVRYGCEMLIQAFPNVQIILATPLQATRGDTPLDKMATARQIIKDCAAFLSANVIEQDKVCGVYYTQEKVGHHNLYDGLHTNATGAKKVGRIIASIVKSMID